MMYTALMTLEGEEKKEVNTHRNAWACAKRCRYRKPLPTSRLACGGRSCKGKSHDHGITIAYDTEKGENPKVAYGGECDYPRGGYRTDVRMVKDESPSNYALEHALSWHENYARYERSF